MTINTNGARKSTMFGMLTDNLRPDKWSITADGEDIYKMGADYWAKIGYMKIHENATKFC